MFFLEGLKRAPNRLTVVLIVVVGTWVDVRTIEVQVVRIVVIVRCTGPIVAVRAPIVRRRIVEVAGVDWRQLELPLQQ